MRLSAVGAVIVFNVALVAALAYLWTVGAKTRWTEPQAMPPALEEAAPLPVSEAADVSQYRQTLERPLFAANRRPAPRKDAEEAQAAADALKDVQLLGTYGSGETGGIVIASGGKVQRVAVGGSIGGWRLTDAGRGRGVELVGADGKRRLLELALNNTAPAVPATKGEGAVPEAARAASADQGPGAEASASAGPGRPSAAPPRSDPNRASEVMRQRMNRINERRAAKGLPPLPGN